MTNISVTLHISQHDSLNQITNALKNISNLLDIINLNKFTLNRKQT